MLTRLATASFKDMTKVVINAQYFLVSSSISYEPPYKTKQQSVTLTFCSRSHAATPQKPEAACFSASKITAAGACVLP